MISKNLQSQNPQDVVSKIKLVGNISRKFFNTRAACKSVAIFIAKTICFLLKLLYREGTFMKYNIIFLLLLYTGTSLFAAAGGGGAAGGGSGSSSSSSSLSEGSFSTSLSRIEDIITRLKEDLQSVKREMSALYNQIQHRARYEMLRKRQGSLEYDLAYQYQQKARITSLSNELRAQALEDAGTWLFESYNDGCEHTVRHKSIIWDFFRQAANLYKVSGLYKKALDCLEMFEQSIQDGIIALSADLSREIQRLRRDLVVSGIAQARQQENLVLVKQYLDFALDKNCLIDDPAYPEDQRFIAEITRLVRGVSDVPHIFDGDDEDESVVASEYDDFDEEAKGAESEDESEMQPAGSKRDRNSGTGHREHGKKRRKDGDNDTE
jgi:hypothetical protein